MDFRKSLLVLALLAGISSAFADPLALASVFSDNAVIQRDLQAPIWGVAAPNARVEVKIEKEGKAVFEIEALADDMGKWLAKTKPFSAGGPYSLFISSKGEETIALTNLLFGDVWICSGQSNMEMSYGRGLTRGKEDIENNTYPEIRLLNVPNKTSIAPVDTFSAKWAVCTPEAAKRFSACGYFFGAALTKELPDVPIGLVDVTWSGTYIQTWLSMDSIANVEELRASVQTRRETIERWNNGGAARFTEELEAWKAKEDLLSTDAVKPLTPSGKPEDLAKLVANSYSACYNGMFMPIFPLAVKGAIWYQGCSNVGNEALYFKLFNAMIDDWRANLSGGDFPIYLVQLAAYRETQNTPRDSAWARMRWVMTQLGETVKNSGTAVAIDVGDHTDIHPKDKKTVGERLARLALNRTYGRKDIVEAGPIPVGVATSEAGLIVSFKNASGLKTSDGAAVSGFQIVDANGTAAWAQAALNGETVVVAVPDGVEASAVRFAWDDYPVCNLVNAEDLPCGPFQLDLK